MVKQGEYMRKHGKYMRNEGEAYIHKNGNAMDNVLWHSDSDNVHTQFYIIVDI